MTLPFYPFYWSDYTGKTYDLSQGEHGAYMLLLRHIYTMGEAIPHEKRFSIARATTEQEQANVEAVLHQYFKKIDAGWVNERAFEIMSEQNEKHGRRVSAGKMGGKAKAMGAKLRSSNATAMPEQSSSNQNQNQNHIKKEKKAGSGDPAFAEWYASYPLKKAPEAAARAYAAAIKRGATHEQLLIGAKRYAMEKKGEEPRFIAHPSTWLNQGRWQDEGVVANVTQMAPDDRQKVRLDSIASCVVKGFTNNLSATDADLAQLVRDGRITEDQARRAGWSGGRMVA